MAFDQRQAIIETAKALGLTPIELATIISYESGFNPNVWGGEGGKHYGSIQFGPAERAQYGVQVGAPESQFGPEGAIVKYMLDRGFVPGKMGLMDAYSTINAGRPGLYNASDEAAGGQPGSVYDKVTQQFAPHRQRAVAFMSSLGEGDYPPRSLSGVGSPDVPASAGGAGPEPEPTKPPQYTLPGKTKKKTRGDAIKDFGKAVSGMGGQDLGLGQAPAIGDMPLSSGPAVPSVLRMPFQPVQAPMPGGSGDLRALLAQLMGG